MIQNHINTFKMMSQNYIGTFKIMTGGMEKMIGGTIPMKTISTITIVGISILTSVPSSIMKSNNETTKATIFDSFCHMLDTNADGVIVKSDYVCDANLGYQPDGETK